MCLCFSRNIVSHYREYYACYQQCENEHPIQLFEFHTVRSKHVFWFAVFEHAYWYDSAEVALGLLRSRFQSLVCLYIVELLCFFLHIINNKTTSMLPRFTKQAFKTSLIKILQTAERNEEMIRILLGTFDKSLRWLEQKYDKQSIRDAVSRICIKSGKNEQEIAWIYVIDGCFWYNQIVYSTSEFVSLQQDQALKIKFESNSVYGILTTDDLQYIKGCYSQRSNKRIIKFIRKYIFYSCYLEDHYMNQFSKFISIEELPYKSVFKWKNEKQISQVALIYKGIVSIQCKQKRNIKIAEITKGMLIMNANESTEKGQISLGLNKVDLKYVSKFKYVSKSSETKLIIFNSKILLQSPYNQNISFINEIKSQYEKYCQTLKSRIVFEEESQLYRRKQSIKKQIKYTKERVIYDSSARLSNNIDYEVPKLYSSISIRESSPDVNQLSLSVISMQASNSSQLVASNSLLSSFATSKNLHIHNAWIESLNKRPKNAKSFSTLHKTNLHQFQREKRNNSLKKEAKTKRGPKFFIPDQFIKKNLKMKFEGMITKLKNIDLSLQKQPQKSLTERVKRLQAQIDEKRIVKLDKIKRKHLLLRDRVEY